MSIGLVGIKTGMTRVFDDSGTSIPVTVINIDSNRISQIKTKDRDGYSAIQVAYGSQKESRLSKALLGHYKKSNIKPARGQYEFRVKELSDDMTVGSDVKIDSFKAGEHVDIIGKSLGKGFQGGVKRHHFKTQDATHGNSVSHRALGSTGQCQDPGRVFKGKKMPGQLGNVQRTIQNLIIVKIMPEENIMLVKGSVPGHKGSVVIIKPTQKKYTPKEIFTETKSIDAVTEPESIKTENVEESTTDTQQASAKTEQVVDDKTDKQTNDNNDKEV
jgi:large subunit ribosomal protein L3